MIDISPLSPSDRQAWQPLAVAYNAFYERAFADGSYERTWQRLMTARELHGLGAHLEGRLVGIAHYLFHASVWSGEACYLADLYVEEAVRGQGAARALIEAVAAAARARGCARYYWQTKEDNARARRLYDQVGRFSGFIRYDYSL
jgi:GNAT superfamily N-acetyltransferase